MYGILEDNTKLELGLTEQSVGSRTKLHRIKYANDMFHNRLHICDPTKKPSFVEKIVYRILKSYDCTIPDETKMKIKDYVHYLKKRKTEHAVATVLKNLERTYSNPAYA